MENRYPLAEEIIKNMNTQPNDQAQEQESVFEEAFNKVIDWCVSSNQEKIKAFVDKVCSENTSMSKEQICVKMINEKSIQSGLFGAVTGVASLAVLPVAITTNMAISWKIQAALINSIAYLYGHTPDNTDLKADILIILLGVVNPTMEILKKLVSKQQRLLLKKQLQITQIKLCSRP